jgi:hypothetical protein
MKFPAKREELEKAGYVYDNDSHCRGCDSPIEWWITPLGAKMPISVVQVKDTTRTFPQPVQYEVRTPHHAVCPAVEQFRKKK